MSDLVTTICAGLLLAVHRQRLPVRVGSTKADEVRRGASEGVR
jgi:hypothetical protein